MPQFFHGILPLIRTATALKVLAPTLGAGTLVGLIARGPGGAGSVFVLLVLSAVVVAIAQQTLP